MCVRLHLERRIEKMARLGANGRSNSPDGAADNPSSIVRVSATRPLAVEITHRAGIPKISDGHAVARRRIGIRIGLRAPKHLVIRVIGSEVIGKPLIHRRGFLVFPAGPPGSNVGVTVEAIDGVVGELMKRHLARHGLRTAEEYNKRTSTPRYGLASFRALNINPK